MTQISSSQLNLVKDPYQFLPLYAGSETAKQGIEVESFFVDKRRLEASDYKKANIATPIQTAVIISKAAEIGLPLQREACGVVEYASDPYSRDLDGTKALIKDTKQSMDKLENIAHSIGLQRIPVSILPNLTLGEAKKNLIDSPRIHAMVKAVKQAHPPEALKLGLLTTSVQMSLSYKTMEQGFKDINRASFLSPILIGMFSSFSGTSLEDYGLNHFRNLRMHYYKSGYSKASGVHPSLNRRVEKPDDFFKDHINHVMSQPLLYYYNKKGKEVFPGNKKVTPTDLFRNNCLTESTFHLAESFMYHDTKICSLRDENQRVTGKRIELRPMDSGGFQPVALAVLTHAFVNREYAKDDDDVFEKMSMRANSNFSLLENHRHSSLYRSVQDLDKYYARDISSHVRNVYSGTGLEETADQVCTLIEQPEKRDSNILFKLSKNKKDLMKKLSNIEHVGIKPLYQLI